MKTQENSNLDNIININLDNLKHNLKVIKSKCPNKRIMAIIKANAYGHGSKMIAKELNELGIKNFGVATLSEALEIRKKIFGNILILNPILGEEMKKALKKDVIFTISSKRELDYIFKNKIRPKVHLQIDSGMGSIGFFPDEALEIVEYILKKDLVDIKGIYSHLSDADNSDFSYTNMQIEKFSQTIKKIKKILPEPNIDIHILNSGGVINFSEHSDFDNIVRPGIMLYGINTTNNSNIKLKAVMSLESKITYIKKLKEDSYISYSKTYLGKKGEKIATIPLGYADGVSRLLSNKGKVYIKGQICDVIGNVCMDRFMVKIPGNLDANYRDEVVIFDETKSVKKIARDLKTIPYEIFTNLSLRVPRVYYKNGKISGIEIFNKFKKGIK